MENEVKIKGIKINMKLRNSDEEYNILDEKELDIFMKKVNEQEDINYIKGVLNTLLIIKEYLDLLFKEFETEEAI